MREENDARWASPISSWMDGPKLRGENMFHRLVPARSVQPIVSAADHGRYQPLGLPARPGGGSIPVGAEGVAGNFHAFVHAVRTHS